MSTCLRIIPTDFIEIIILVFLLPLFPDLYRSGGILRKYSEASIYSEFDGGWIYFIFKRIARGRVKKPDKRKERKKKKMPHFEGFAPVDLTGYQWLSKDRYEFLFP